VGEAWQKDEQVGARFGNQKGFIEACRWLRAQKAAYELAGDRMIVMTGALLTKLIGEKHGWMKDEPKPMFHLVVPFSKLSGEQKVKAARHRLLLDR